MAWSGTKSKVVTAVLGVAVILAAVAAKLSFFPSVKEAYFAMNERSLQAAPFGLVVVRPTHFPKAARKGVLWGSAPRFGKPVWRMMGRNVSLQDLFGAAYEKSADRVVLPATAPKTNFDFLVTATGDQRQRLQSVLRQKLGLVARTELRDTEVLELKTNDASSSRLTVSAAASEDVHLDNGKLHFTHVRVQDLLRGLEQVTKLPVVDKTTLTNYYDFSVDWGPQMMRQLQNEATAADAVKKILDDLGLTLEPDEDQTEMLVVKSAT
ncbi:MAG: TIGR03435 family protein [Verrucomicrobiota bacterium]|jgi:uncharacterized protein (TIGR03435 family)